MELFDKKNHEINLSLINQMEYMNLATDEEKAKFAYSLGYQAAVRDFTKRLEQVNNINVSQNDEDSELDNLGWSHGQESE